MKYNDLSQKNIKFEQLTKKSNYTELEDGE